MPELFKENVGRIAKGLIAFSFAMLFKGENSSGQVEDYCSKSVRVLRGAVSGGETIFIKVHAAENLIYHNYTAGLDTTFATLQMESPENYIGSTRVLARLYKNEPKQYQHYIDQLLNEFKQGSNRKTSLTALESLGKLGYRTSLAEIERYADTGTIGFKGMARWVLSNNKKTATENKLSELLLSKDILDYRYAAYALRFKDRVNKLSLMRLKDCFDTIERNDIARVYVASSLFVHSAAKQKKNAKTILLTYLKGDVGQRYEVAEALGKAGDGSDVSTLQKLVDDENTDVRVAAANALLRIMHCKKINN